MEPMEPRLDPPLDTYYPFRKDNNSIQLSFWRYRSWRLTTIAKLSIDVSDVFSHELSRKGLQ